MFLNHTNIFGAEKVTNYLGKYLSEHYQFEDKRNNPEYDYLDKQAKEYSYIALMEKPEIKDAAASWFHSKWGVPKEAYLECMDAYLQNETEYGWYLCLDGNQIIGGMGVIENDFHDRKDLTPNVCAV